MANKDQDPITLRIREVRTDYNLTMKNFAAMLGHTMTKQQSIENHGRVPAEPYIDLLCDVFYVSKEWLLTGQGEKYTMSSKDLVDWLNSITDQMKRKTFFDMVRIMKKMP